MQYEPFCAATWRALMELKSITW